MIHTKIRFIKNDLNKKQAPLGACLCFQVNF